MAKLDPYMILAAIHRHCMVCSGMERKAVHMCPVTNCDLYKYREAAGTPAREPRGKRIDPLPGQIRLDDLLGGRRKRVREG